MGRGLREKTEKGRDRLLVPKTHVALQGGAGLRKVWRLCHVSMWLVCTVRPRCPPPCIFPVRVAHGAILRKTGDIHTAFVLSSPRTLSLICWHVLLV